MDPYLEATYRSACLIAAAQITAPRETWSGEDEDEVMLVELANRLFERIVPDELRAGDVVATGTVQPHPDEEAFLEETRRKAAEQLAAKEANKMARAAAIADKDNQEFAPREETFGVTR